MRGLVIKNTGSWYEVRTDERKLIQCKIKGNFRLRGIRSTNPVAVGDVVDLNENPDGTAFICEIEPRRNYIIRRASNLSKQSHILAANLDLVLLVITVSSPQTSTVFIDRFLASAEAYRIPVILLFNKMDIYNKVDKERVKVLSQLYASIGYTCLSVSVKNREGLKFLPKLLKDKITLIAGNSGVGKSALLNSLIPSAHASTAPISSIHNTGMHTTTFSELYDLTEGGSLIDIPGVKGFGTFDFEPEEVSHYFREIFKYSQGCRFSNCMHLEEPECAVRKAVEEGKIAGSRYQAYISMLSDKNEERYRPAY